MQYSGRVDDFFSFRLIHDQHHRIANNRVSHIALYYISILGFAATGTLVHCPLRVGLLYNYIQC